MVTIKAQEDVNRAGLRSSLLEVQRWALWGSSSAGTGAPACILVGVEKGVLSFHELTRGRGGGQEDVRCRSHFGRASIVSTAGQKVPMGPSSFAPRCALGENENLFLPAECLLWIFTVTVSLKAKTCKQTLWLSTDK